MATKTASREKKAIKVKIFKPDAFIIDFHGTICPMKWEDEVILPFVVENLNGYLMDNWAVIDLMNLIDTLRQESFIQRFKFNRNDAPLIEEDSDDLESARRSICEFVMWQITNRKETKTCINLQRLVWHKGMAESKLKTVIFDDVPAALERWKSKSISVYVVSSVEREEMCLFLKHTSHGDLTKYITDYFDSSIGKWVLKETYLKIAKTIGRDIRNLAFITDLGKKAKMAAEAGAESLLVLRPKNFRIREYYLTCFQSVSSFDEIELVERRLN